MRMPEDAAARLHALRERADALVQDGQVPEALTTRLIAADLAEESGMRVEANLLRSAALQLVVFMCARERWPGLRIEEVRPVRARGDDLRLRPVFRFIVAGSSVYADADGGYQREPPPHVATVGRNDRVRFRKV